MKETALKTPQNTGMEKPVEQDLLAALAVIINTEALKKLYAMLDKGINTGTEAGRAWLTVRDAIRSPSNARKPVSFLYDADGRLSPETRELLKGMSVSIDVSTCDDDAGHRYMGKVAEVMDAPDDKHGVTLLVQDAEPNFQPRTAFNFV